MHYHFCHQHCLSWVVRFFHFPLFVPSPEILACTSNPCQNGSTCFDNNGGSGYVCLCPAGFEGTNCENGTSFSWHYLNYCNYTRSLNMLIIVLYILYALSSLSSALSCINHILCILFFLELSGFMFSLSFIFPVEILACASNPCQNRATCFDNNGDSGYVCLCPAGFEGTNCENGTYYLSFPWDFSTGL